VFEYEIPLDNGWEVPREYLTLGDTLGEGAFGKVVRAEINIGKPGIPNVVAVKMLKGEQMRKTCNRPTTIPKKYTYPENENGLKWIEIFFYLNAYFK